MTPSGIPKATAAEPSLDAVFGGRRPGASTPPSTHRRQSRRWVWAALLLLLTVASTLYVGDWQYALWIVVILVAHEAGHFLQARRYGLNASPPYFIPFPVQPLGTLGAVIQLRRRIPHRRALFDVAVSGPLAGLVPALLLSVVGVMHSRWAPIEANPWHRDDPLLFDLLGHVLLGAPPEGFALLLHPMAMAGWAGVYITALNLMPIGQLDGGHILYALLDRRAYAVSMVILGGSFLAVTLFGHWQWLLPLLILWLIGLRHPPTLDDVQDLGGVRTALGWLVLLFVLIGWSPRPFIASLG